MEGSKSRSSLSMMFSVRKRIWGLEGEMVKKYNEKTYVFFIIPARWPHPSAGVSLGCEPPSSVVREGVSPVRRSPLPPKLSAKA